MKLQRLRELALGATQGEWVYFPKPKYEITVKDLQP